MPGIVRVGDAHAGHASPTPNPTHKTSYAAGSGNVFVNGQAAVRVDDATSCGDKAAAGSDFVEMKNREIVAIIAYLQRLGTDIKVKEIIEETAQN